MHSNLYGDHINENHHRTSNPFRLGLFLVECCTGVDHPPKKDLRRISASRIISAERDREGARCAYRSISTTTLLII